MQIKLNSFVIFSFVFLSACASRNIHQSDQQKPDVLRRQWVVPVPPLSSQYGKKMEYTAPRLDGNTLVFGSTKVGIMAMYPELLAQRWQLNIENGLLSHIEKSGEFYYFVGGDGNVYSVQADTGKVKWTYPLRNPIASRPKVASGKVFLTTSDDTVVAIDENTGQWVWHYRRRNISGPTIHGAATPFPVGEDLWVSFADGALVAVTQKEGKVLWERQLNTFKKFTDVDADPLRVEDVIYWPAYDGAIYALSPKDGKTIWMADDVGGAQGVTLVGENIVVAGANGIVVSMNRQNGKIDWRFEVDRGVPGIASQVGSTIIIPSSGEYIYALTLDGKLQSRVSVGYGSGFVGQLATDPKRPWFYGMTRGGNLMAFSVH